MKWRPFFLKRKNADVEVPALAQPRADASLKPAPFLHPDSETETIMSSDISEFSAISESAPLIVLEQVSRIYDQGAVSVVALDGVNLTVKKGEFLAIVGPSGSGKSTLMNILGCLDRPTSGSYLLDGQLVEGLNDDGLAAIRSRAIGFVFQSYNLLPRTSALVNVETPLMYQGVNKKERAMRAQQVLTQLGLSDRLGHEPSTLSGGQQQRVGIARALVTEPAIILADEPTGNLDSHAGAEVIEILHTLHAKGRTIILITHDAEVASAADRTIHIRDGQLLDNLAGVN
jgi:putative ABC transport system ATP-binding protein